MTGSAAGGGGSLLAGSLKIVVVVVVVVAGCVLEDRDVPKEENDAVALEGMLLEPGSMVVALPVLDSVVVLGVEFVPKEKAVAEDC